MTVLLVVATIAVFLAIDYVRGKRRVEQFEPEAESQPRRVTRVQPEYVAGFQLPANLQYHPGHTWALQESPTLVRVGIDDFGARLIGKISSIELPRRGQWIRQGQKVLVVKKDGRTAELVSPIEGEVTGTNETLANRTDLVTCDPYGAGWLLTVMSPDAQTNFRNLLGGNLARQWMAETASRLRAKLPALVGVVAQDGGLAVGELSDELPDQEWSELAREFFLA
jgi:glycine cleavage system H protein